MEIKDIEKLLDRYWNCETTLEEEKLIRNFFSENGSAPNHMERSRAFFTWQDRQAKIKSDSGKQIMTVIHKNESKSYFYPFLKVAVSILIVLSAGIGIYTHHMQEKRIDQTHSETYSDPEAAMKEAQAALNKVSSSLTKGEKIIRDNLIECDTTDKIE